MAGVPVVITLWVRRRRPAASAATSPSSRSSATESRAWSAVMGGSRARPARTLPGSAQVDPYPRQDARFAAESLYVGASFVRTDAGPVRVWLQSSAASWDGFST